MPFSVTLEEELKGISSYFYASVVLQGNNKRGESSTERKGL